jgi:hypothetical protein
LWLVPGVLIACESRNSFFSYDKSFESLNITNSTKWTKDRTLDLILDMLADMFVNTVYKLFISFAYLAPCNKTLYQNLNHLKGPF